jgi:Ohr subfamily peroxiredoxin
MATPTVLFSGKTHTTPASNGHDNIDIRTSSPGSEGPAFEGIASHPTAEKLFAGAWSACYMGALGLVAAKKKVKLPADLSVDIEVDLLLSGSEYFLQARFDVVLPGFDQALAESIAHEADAVCPYSKAVRGNIDVALNVIVS